MTADYAALVRDGKVWVGVLDRSIVGLVVLSDCRDSLELDNISVSPSLQGRGVGRQLLAFVEARGLALDKHAITLHTNERMAENIAMYWRIGNVATRHDDADGFERRVV